PFGALNLLPILDRQSPKHASGVMVFFLVAAAGLALDALPRMSRRHGWIALASLLGYLVGLVLTIVGRRGGFGQIQPGEILGPALLVTVTVVGLVVLATGLTLGRDLRCRRTAVLFGGISLAEL